MLPSHSKKDVIYLLLGMQNRFLRKARQAGVQAPILRKGAANHYCFYNIFCQFPHNPCTSYATSYTNTPILLCVSSPRVLPLILLFLNIAKGKGTNLCECSSFRQQQLQHTNRAHRLRRDKSTRIFYQLTLHLIIPVFLTYLSCLKTLYPGEKDWNKVFEQINNYSKINQLSR